MSWRGLSSAYRVRLSVDGMPSSLTLLTLSGSGVLQPEFFRLLQKRSSFLYRIEIGSFVSATALPQLRDTPEILAAAANIVGLKRRCSCPANAAAAMLSPPSRAMCSCASTLPRPSIVRLMAASTKRLGTLFLSA